MPRCSKKLCAGSIWRERTIMKLKKKKRNFEQLNPIFPLPHLLSRTKLLKVLIFPEKISSHALFTHDGCYKGLLLIIDSSIYVSFYISFSSLYDDCQLRIEIQEIYDYVQGFEIYVQAFQFFANLVDDPCKSFVF